MVDSGYYLGTLRMYTNGDNSLSLYRTQDGVLGDWSFAGNGWTEAVMDIRPERCCDRLDSNGDYLDPPALTLVKKSPADTGYLNFAGIRLDIDSIPGKFSISIARKTLPAGMYVFDIVLTNTDGERSAFAKGFIDMKQGVTDA